jgi:uncharacterized protein with HEPN domain
MRDEIGDKQRLIHILEAISEIESYIKSSSFDDFISNSMMRFASIKQIEIIGEASNFITDITKNKFSDIEWQKIIGLRHVLVHEYFGVDMTIIWQIIEKDIPELKLKIEHLINEIE